MHPIAAIMLRCAALSPVLALAACSTPDMSDYPSLARRPVEQRIAPVPGQPASEAPPAPVSATLADAITALVADASRGDAAFRSTLADYRDAALAGRGAAEGSEAWASAEVALSRIDAARAPTRFALAELDRLGVDALDAGDLSGAEAVTLAQSRLVTLLAAQDSALATLATR